MSCGAFEHDRKYIRNIIKVLFPSSWWFSVVWKKT